MLGRSFLACVVLLAACSNSSGSAVPADTGTASALTPANATWCAANPPAGCADVAVCGVCVRKPAAPLTRTTDTKEYKGSGAPDVSCFTATPAPVEPSKKVKLRGWVKIFANGPDSKNVKVEVFEEKVDATGLPMGELGASVGTGTSNDKVAACADPPVWPCAKTEKKLKSGVESTRTLYPFEIDGIPTEKPLVVKTSESVADAGWFPLYDWNVAARNKELNAMGEYEFDVRALGNDDYASILKAAYSQPPQGGESAVAGEVHDCGDVRVSNATVGIFPRPRYQLFYLSEIEDDPLPDSSRQATGKLGLYAVGGAKPGVFTVSSTGMVGSDIVALGSYKVSTFADSVSVYTFRGLRPWQVPKK